MAKVHFQKDINRYLFFCPGCQCGHWFNETTWQFNGDVDKPTVSPSILVRDKIICHSFVNNGMIQFLSDCTHELAGQTVEIPDWNS